MRLLQKSEIDKANAEATRKTIDEGIKIARRIDSLRETASQEEKSLEDFRVKTVKVIHSEIDSLIHERDALTTEVEELRKAKKEAQKPLDAEWKRVSVEKIAIQAMRNDATQALENAFLDRKEAQSILNDAKSTMARAQTREDIATANVDKTTERKREIAFLLEDTRRQNHKAVRLKERLEALTKKALHENKVRALQFENERLSIKEEKDKLRKEWILLNDRKELLERNIKRNK